MKAPSNLCSYGSLKCLVCQVSFFWQNSFSIPLNRFTMRICVPWSWGGGGGGGLGGLYWFILHSKSSPISLHFQGISI